MRAIRTEGYGKVTTPADHGPAAVLEWIRICDLVVDDSYQREIVGPGRSNVRKIAAEFNWTKFTPVIVAPLEGGLYAIVDGQHRTTAAAICGAEKVPCAIMLTDRAGQAAAFRAINGLTTTMKTTTIHHAAVQAGDADALELKEVCDIAGVTVLRTQIPANQMKAGETSAVAALQRALKKHGRDTLITALQCITETSEGNPGLLVGTVIAAVADALHGKPEWCDAGSVLFEAFDNVKLGESLENAKLEAQKRPNVGASAIMAQDLREYLSGFFDPVGVEPQEEAA